MLYKKLVLSFSTKIAAAGLLVAGILIGVSGAAFAMPPHPELIREWKTGKKAMPDFIANPQILTQRGINQPLRAPGIQGIDGTSAQSAPQKASLSGNANILVVLVDFSDTPASVAATSFDNLAFNASAPSVRHYFDEVSYSTVTIVTVNMPSTIGTGGARAGWQRAPALYSYYVGGQGGTGPYSGGNSQHLCEDVVDAIDGVVDFSQYDNDGDSFVDSLTIVHAGPGAEYTGNESAHIWSHAWAITPRLKDGVYVFGYNTVPEYWAFPGDMTIGVFCHEMGHSLWDLPDLYDRDYSSEGAGDWSLMASGSWNGPLWLGSSPAHPDAWSRVEMGYASATVISDNTTGLSIPQVETNSADQIFYLWNDGEPNNEYFLVENRQKTGYDAHLPGNGLLIWHCDDDMNIYSDGYQNDTECLSLDNSNCGSLHYLVALEQADGDIDLEYSYNYGDAGDPFPGVTNHRTFNANSNPNNSSYAFGYSRVTVTNISDSGSTMTADVSVGSTARTNQFFQWIPNYSGTSAPELARAGINYGNARVMAQVKDASTDIQLEQVFFTLNFEPISLVVLPDFSGTSAAELAMLGRRASDGANLAHVADASSGALTKRVYFHAEFIPYDMEWMPDFGQTSAPELVTLARRPGDAAIMGAKRDASSRLLLGPRTWFHADFLPADIEVTVDANNNPMDINGNGVAELVSLQQRTSDDAMISEVRDASTNVLIQRVWYDNSYTYTPLDVEVMSDFGGDTTAPELAMLRYRPDNGEVAVEMHDALADSSDIAPNPLTTVIFDSSYSPVDLEVVSDFSGNGAPELVVLGYRASDDAVAGEVRDASAGTHIITVSFDSAYRPQGIEVLPSFGTLGTSAPELAVHGVNPSDGTVIGEIKDASSGDPVSTATFSPYFVIP